jgi:hypothetical protein
VLHWQTLVFSSSDQYLVHGYVPRLGALKNATPSVPSITARDGEYTVQCSCWCRFSAEPNYFLAGFFFSIKKEKREITLLNNASFQK